MARCWRIMLFNGHCSAATGYRSITSLNITEDFHILHSAYVYICYSILKAKTYNWLPNTHTHTWPATTTNKKQLGTSHLLLMVISLAQIQNSKFKFHLQNSEALRVIKNIKKLLTWTGYGDANEGTCLKRSHWFGKRHKTDAFTKLGNLLSELHVPHKQCLTGISDAFSASFTSIWPSFFTVPPTKHAYSALHPQALTECSPLNFRRSSIITINQPTHKPHKHESPHTVIQSIHL